MSIEKLDFTLCSQAYSYKLSSKLFCEALFFAYCPANFEVAPLLILDKRKAGISPGLLLTYITLEY